MSAYGHHRPRTKPPPPRPPPPLFVDLTGPDTHPTHPTPTPPLPLDLAEATTRTYEGAHLCPKTATQNSRTRRRLRFAAAPSPSPLFIQPSKVYSSSTTTTTTTTTTSTTIATATPSSSSSSSSSAAGGRLQQQQQQKQKQILPQPSKADFARPGPRRDNKPKPYVLEPPPPAQLYPESRCTDFFPWRGNHAEDHVTDAQARNGQFDKLFVGKGNNEQASARASLTPIFKQKAGLATMSSLFLTVLDKRQKYGRFTAPSTFKPPPRVTLPDARREAWLRDLASPNVSLRKLSRTIPHGLKGPVLLDQCTAKGVPTARAVWFARCVGANELRGLKRKGVGSFAVGSETKWIKEWTTQVTRFLEKTIVGCTATEGWKAKMLYAIRLSAHLYWENLLDKTLFLEWFLGFLEACSLDMLPMAYMLSSIYWDELLRTRRLGRRLAEALLGKAEAIIAAEENEVYAPLMHRLSVMLADILVSHRESLVIANSWDGYKDVLSRSVHRRNPTIRSCLANLTARNKNLLAPLDHNAKAATTLSPQRKLINTLDAITLPYNLDELWAKCYSSTTTMAPADLVQVLCEWGTTSLRVGVHRVYIAAALLRAAAARTSPAAVHEQLLHFLETFGTKVAGSKHDAYLLISELVRSKTFALAAYMKWLIARGSLYGFDTMHASNPCHVRLLAEIPVYTAPTAHRNLRKILLANAGYDVTEEARALAQAKEILAGRLAGDGAEEALTERETAFFAGLSRTVMCELGIWIRDNVRMHVVKGAPVGRDNWRDLSVEVGITAVTTGQFVLLRGLLEMFQDMAVLVDVVKMVSSSDSSSTLSEAADTVSYNAEAFSALGAVNECLRLLHNRYKKLQLRRRLERFLVVALAELAAVPGASGEIRRQLEEDLAAQARCEPRVGMANSPVSDTMADVFDGGNEEIDRLLAAGASIDNHNLSRLFETIVSKVETTFDDAGAQSQGQGQLASSVGYLTKLRQFDTPMFDDLMHSWITRLLQSSSRPPLPLLHTLSILVASSTLALRTVVTGTLAAPKPTADLIAQTLELLTAPLLPALSQCDMYSLRRKRKSFAQAAPALFVRLLRRAIALCAEQQAQLTQRLRALVLSRGVLDLLRGVATERPQTLLEEVVEPLSRRGGPGVLLWLRRLVDHLLDDAESGDSTDLDPEVQVAQLVQYANDFSIGLCQLKMRIIFGSGGCGSGGGAVGGGGVGGVGGGEQENPLTKPFFQGIAATFKDRVNIWTDLVSVLNAECAAQIRHYAEELLLSSSTFPPVRLCLGPLEPSLPEGGEALARALLAVIEATAYSIPPGGVPGVAAALAEKLVMIVGGMEEGWEVDVGEWRCWLLLFLRHEFVRKDEELFDFVFDITSSFIDDLPDETTQHIRRFTRGKKPTPRMSYLIGSSSGTEWLKAFQRGKMIDYPVKPWEKLAEPSPVMGENDTSVSLVLFMTRRGRCSRV
ncbi:hypothetical protein P167DRAFT_560154 [Morchella conica CCBAS932]|uniref:Mediator of RNA polymerase II transcription subunit 12 n=1 Tax=Morchella conica CCBAS932 TaxID=1392247 RepID=A0A3N4KJC6_9PEZI|nr:hypothetical protein P167DRAFT_560154 [Morchella conica CCBAS932]